MANNASLTISVISLVVSLISVSCVLLRCEPMTMDWMGMLVGILSLLVTILIGWQIYNVLQVEKKIHDVLGNAIGETTKKMLIKTEESKEEAIGTSLFNLGQAMFYNGFYIHALDNFIKALGAIRKSSMDNKEMHIEKCFRDIMITIECMRKDIDSYSISKRTLSIYSNLLSGFHDDRIFEIMEFLRSLRMTDD